MAPEACTTLFPVNNSLAQNCFLLYSSGFGGQQEVGLGEVSQSGRTDQEGRRGWCFCSRRAVLFWAVTSAEKGSSPPSHGPTPGAAPWPGSGL